MEIVCILLIDVFIFIYLPTNLKYHPTTYAHDAGVRCKHFPLPRTPRYVGDKTMYAHGTSRYFYSEAGTLTWNGPIVRHFIKVLGQKAALNRFVEPAIEGKRFII